MKKMFTSLFLLIFLFGTSAFAAHIYVDSNAGDGGDGISWETAFNDLQDALAIAESDDTIHVAQGTYLPDTAINPDATFLLDVDLTLLGGYQSGGGERNPDMYETILSGDLNGDDVDGNFFTDRSDNVETVVTVSAGVAALIDGFTIRGGHANSSNLNAAGCGGGLYSVGGNTEIRQCDFYQNYAQRRGGALYLIDGAASLELCEMNGNLANNGGAAFLDNIQLYSTNCSFSENLTFNGEDQANGGALFTRDLIGLIQDCTFQNNSAAAYGGGFELYYPEFSPASSVEITGCSFQNNAAMGGGGLSVYTRTANTEVTLSDCTFSGNSVNEEGGGLAMWAYGAEAVFNIDSCMFVQNEANTDVFSAGGGLLVKVYEQNGSVTLSNSEFSGNKARISGGGASFRSNEDGSGSCVVTNTIFENNEAQWNGGMDFYHPEVAGEVTNQISNCQFLNNTATRRGGGLGLVSAGSNSFLVEDCLLEGNISDSLYGGIHLIVNHPETDIRISRCALLNNDGQGGSAMGGGYSSIFQVTGDHTEATIVLENCLMSGNEGPGGTIGMEDLGHMKMINCTAADNPAGGIVQTSSSVLTVQNTILHNPGTEYLALTNDVSLTSLGGNLLSDDSFGSLASPEDHENVEDPMFVGTGDYCTYYQLSEDSRGVDEGLEWADTSDEDLCGNMRAKGNRIDIGALESSFTSSVQERLTGDLILSPNPATDLLHIEWPEELVREGAIRIFDAQGNLVQQVVLEQGQPVAVAHLPAGLYILELRGERTVFVGRFVKP